jgi:hypothetical protein
MHPRRIILLAAALALSAAIVIGPGQAAQAADLVTVPGSAERAVPSTGVGDVVFPVTLTVAGEQATSIEPTVVDVTFGSQTLPAPGIEPSLDTDAGKLVLTLTDPAVFSRAGDYEVVLRLATESGDSQLLSVTLTRPAAGLSAGGTVEVVDYTGFLSELNPDSHPDLSLSVGSGGELLAVGAAQTERDAGTVRLSADCATEPCALDSGSPVALAEPVGPDGRLRLDYSIDGFELGATTRVVEVRSPQLAAPVNITFTVSERLSPALIVLITLAGLAAGLLVRVVLTGAIERSQRQTMITDLKRVIAGLKPTYPNDKDLGKKLDAVSNVLNGRLSTPEIERQRTAVREAVDAANAAWDAAHEAYEKDAAEVAGPWRLPVDISLAYESMRSALAERSTAIASRSTDDLDAASTASLGAARTLAEASAAWLAKYRRGLEAYETTAAAVDGQVQSVFTAAKAKAVDDPGSSVAALTAVSACVAQWRTEIRGTAARTIDALAPRDDDLAKEAYAAVDLDDPAEAVTQASAIVKKLFAIPAPSKAPGTVVESESAREPLAEPEEDTAQEPLPVLPAPVHIALALAASRAVSRGIEWAATLARFLVLAVIVCFVVYWVTVQAWVGTTDQVMAVFGWAFALDVSVSAVAALFGASAVLPSVPGAAAQPGNGQ